MSIFEQLLLSHRLLPQQIVRLEPELFHELGDIAAAEGKSVEEFTMEALYELVYERRVRARIESQWESLTTREREVAALACLGYKNSDIAALLTISVNTVRTHMQNVLDKYKIGSKVELRMMLSNWDFDTWFESQHWAENDPKADSSSGTTAMS